MGQSLLLELIGDSPSDNFIHNIGMICSFNSWSCAILFTIKLFIRKLILCNSFIHNLFTKQPNGSWLWFHQLRFFGEDPLTRDIDNLYVYMVSHPVGHVKKCLVILVVKTGRIILHKIRLNMAWTTNQEWKLLGE
jgi:hypothetical protein